MNNSCHYFILLITLLVFVHCFCNSSFADDRSNAKGLGMSTSAVVSSYGIDAYGINPANYFSLQQMPIRKLKLSHKGQMSSFEEYMKRKKNVDDYVRPFIEISLVSVGGGYGSDKTLDFYSTYLNYLSIHRETFANRFLNLDSVFNFRQNVLPDKNTQVNYDFELKWFSINITKPGVGAFNFTISDKVGLNTNVASKETSFPLPEITGNNNGSYNILKADLHLSEALAWWIRKYTVGYARQFTLNGLIKNFTVGFSAGLVHGFGNATIYSSGIYMNTYGIKRDSIGNHIDSVSGKQDFYSLQSLTDFFQDYIDGARSHFNFFPRPAGKGYSFDFGINVQITDNIWAAASITELGKIRWDYNTLINRDTSKFLYSDFHVVTSDPTYNAFVNDLDGLDTRIPNHPFTTDMPTKYRAGILIKPFESLSLELDWERGANDLPSNSTLNKVSLGGEYYPIPSIPVRAGFSIGGVESFNIAVGTGFHFDRIGIDIATYNLNKIWFLFHENNRISVTISGKLII